jgi:polyisoprenyl-phosphate glycosyltransferase
LGSTLGLILRVTDNFSAVQVKHQHRETGKSNYTVRKLISLWLNVFINFSIKPLRAFTLFGILVVVLSVLFIIYLVIDKVNNPYESQGWASIMVSITFFSGIQIIFLGLMSEYLGKHYLTTNNTPQWTIKKHSF